ncbi:GFA family protein [Inquilinus limosus]|uniref:GFA family protein n=1 Tax=Inquilinus limosus TaxID=171674 RepID=UPI0004088441|nr:GFA family protein [Inquilinus limosus]
MTDQTGGCLCGAVRYRVTGPLRQVVACHCGQCRRTSGHYAAFTACAADNLVLESDRTLRWYRSSPEAERGFCGECGSNLFWKPAHGRAISIAAGTLDGATGLRIGAHLFTADKGDYYAIAGDAPQWPRYPAQGDPGYPRVPGLG